MTYCTRDMYAHGDRARLIAEARALIASAEAQGRDLTDFEAGRVDMLLDLAARHAPNLITKNQEPHR